MRIAFETTERGVGKATASRLIRFVVIVAAVTSGAVLTAVTVRPAGRVAPDAPAIQWFFDAAQPDAAKARPALEQIAAVWRDGYAALIIDLVRLMQPAGRRSEASPDPIPAVAGSTGPTLGGSTGPTLGPLGRHGVGVTFPIHRDPGRPVRRRLLRFLADRTGQRFGDDLRRWRRWMWARPYEPHPAYAAFKGVLYGQVDPRLRQFFPPHVPSVIRLDEVDWGGVGVNGIPPLDHPVSIRAGEAGYLKDNHLVFGVAVNGQARAYPRRILAWHEMALDRLGGEELTVVYCTLCGTVIPYDSVVGGRLRTFGTSGLLYRSNKLMFDAGTSSLWSTLEGRPVVGPLAGSGLTLHARSVVTTTWGEWKAQHPETTVLSIETGYDRDYREGAAYRDYFSTDRLRFEVPRTDDRLKHKDEVVVLRAGDGAAPRALAMATKFLKKHPAHHLEFAGRRLVAITSPKGATRVYEAGTERFARRLDAGHVADVTGHPWRVTEEALLSAGGSPRRLARVPAHRAFWFAWYAQFPGTDLIK